MIIHSNHIKLYAKITTISLYKKPEFRIFYKKIYSFTYQLWSNKYVDLLDFGMDIPYGISPVAHPQIVTPTNIFHTVVKNILKIGKKKTG